MPTLLITGANRGIGLEFTRQYLTDGWRVIATCRNPATAASLHALANQSALQVEQLDATDQPGVAALAHKLSGVALDLLINNAGIYSGNLRRNPDLPDVSQSFGTIDATAWSQVFAVNSIAPIMVTQSFLPNLLLGQTRKIAMITSKMGSIELLNTQGDIAYRTSKTALNAALHNIAMTLAPENFVVAGLHPGWVQTDMGGKQASLTVATSVSALRALIAQLTPAQSGSFLNYDGSILAW